ncbi:heterokaryon incompatibility protein-domain-containing protein [Immersiella caudata]|uniref:Heterokaryon incompatibility protein-domain-containing protein n=1 Tax=Immersiella caudata TaxID=314043 RepID=A0AA40C2F6_9PEZI|nr:heterokaryon incompatibility protein-domain-containing protein [Immersiella caudata]
MESWHNGGCQRQDVRSIGSLITCMACGSIDFSILENSAETASLAPSDGIDSMSSADELSDDGEFSSSEESLPLGSQVNVERAARYVYDNLGQSNIRLLSISPGNFGDELCCQLVQEDLNRFPLYDAISYTWADDSGDREKNKTIRLGHELLIVTTSCQLALRRARLHQMQKIWIDAVCINQDDNNERTHQVRLMAQIYANARSVLVYIGEESATSSETINLLAEGMTDKVHGDAVTDLLSRPYFWRVWVLQEIALARKATLVCGGTTIRWADFATRVQGLPMFGRIAFKALLTRPPPHITYGFCEPDAKWPVLRDEPGQISGVPLALSFLAPEFRSIEDLPRLLDLSSFCEATDPRDQVYALLGLTAGTEGYGFFPDYSTDLKEVYVRTAILIAVSCGVLPLLVRAVCRPSISPALPWVPDWRSYSPISPLALTGEASILDIIRQEVGNMTAHGGSSLSRDLSTATSVHFTAAPICTFLDLFNAEDVVLAHFFPAQNSSNVGLIFSPETRRNLVAGSSNLIDSLGSLWLFQVQPQPPVVSNDAPSGCLRGCLLLSSPIGFTPTETADSVVELPFLGLVKFLGCEDGFGKENLKSWDPRQARLSTELPKLGYPDVQNLAQFGVVCKSATQLKAWDRIRKLLGEMTETLERIHEWQELSLRIWRDRQTREEEMWSPWPAVLWGLWILSGLRRWELQTWLHGQEAHENDIQKLGWVEWRVLQLVVDVKNSGLQEHRYVLETTPSRDISTSKTLWNRWRRGLEVPVWWRLQIDEWIGFRDELASQLQSLLQLKLEPTLELEYERQQAGLLRELGGKCEWKLLKLTEFPKQRIPREQLQPAERLEREWRESEQEFLELDLEESGQEEEELERRKLELRRQRSRILGEQERLKGLARRNWVLLKLES